MFVKQSICETRACIFVELKTLIIYPLIDFQKENNYKFSSEKINHLDARKGVSKFIGISQD